MARKYMYQYKWMKVEESKVESVKVCSSLDIKNEMKKHYASLTPFQEHFTIICLNRNNKIITYKTLFTGGLHSTIVEAKIAFKLALESNSSAIILVHNHPSGNIKPSQSDIDLTKKINSFGKMIDLPVLDHIIINEENDYFSFCDEGISF